MNVDHPHDIVRSSSPLSDEYLALTEEEAAELETKTPEERAAWLQARRARVQAHLLSREKALADLRAKFEAAGRGAHR